MLRVIAMRKSLNSKLNEHIFVDLFPSAIWQRYRARSTDFVTTISSRFYLLLSLETIEKEKISGQFEMDFELTSFLITMLEVIVGAVKALSLCK